MDRRKTAFVFKRNNTVGNGLYQMTACFTALGPQGVHVPFSFVAHSENEYLIRVGDAIACDGSCRGHLGQMEDYSEKRLENQYYSEPIVLKATNLNISAYR